MRRGPSRRKVFFAGKQIAGMGTVNIERTAVINELSVGVPAESLDPVPELGITFRLSTFASEFDPIPKDSIGSVGADSANVELASWKSRLIG